MHIERRHGWEWIWDNQDALREYKRRRFGFLWIRDDDELRPIGESCVRKNLHKVDSAGYFNGSHSWEKYQMWRKHLFTKKGVCRRCGLTKARQEELKDTIRYWEKPLVITPIE
jgi:hypothetical protein